MTIHIGRSACKKDVAKQWNQNVEKYSHFWLKWHEWAPWPNPQCTWAGTQSFAPILESPTSLGKWLFKLYLLTKLACPKKNTRKTPENISFPYDTFCRRKITDRYIHHSTSEMLVSVRLIPSCIGLFTEGNSCSCSLFWQRDLCSAFWLLQNLTNIRLENRQTVG